MISIRERWLMIQAYQVGYSRGQEDTVEGAYSFDCATCLDDWLADMAADAVTVADVLDKDAPKESPRKMNIIECTKEHPWDGVSRDDQRVRHHDTEEIGEQWDGWPAGDIITIRCKNCGIQWETELPQ